MSGEVAMELGQAIDVLQTHRLDQWVPVVRRVIEWFAGVEGMVESPEQTTVREVMYVVLRAAHAPTREQKHDELRRGLAQLPQWTWRATAGTEVWEPTSESFAAFRERRQRIVLWQDESVKAQRVQEWLEAQLECGSAGNEIDPRS